MIHLVFLGQPLSGAPIHVGSSLTQKYQTMLEMLDSGKRSSLFDLFVSDGEKSFTTLALGRSGS